MQTRSIVGTTGRQMAFRQAIAQWRAPLARSISHAGLGLRVSQGSTCCQKFVLNQAVRSLVVAREALRQANTSAKTTTTAPPQSGAAPEAQGYKKPPKEIADIVDAPPPPALSYSPDRSMFLQMYLPSALPPIYELARDELKLAGLRIEPDIWSRSKTGYYTKLALLPATEMVPAPDDKVTPITGYPEGSWLNYASWSQDGRSIAFTTRSSGAPGAPPRRALELWVADAATGAARCLLGHHNSKGLNTILDDYSWLDDDHLLACVVPEGTGAPPEKPPMPLGPRIEDNSSGKKAQNRTYPDLLQDEHDVSQFEYYCSSELVVVNIHSGEIQKIGPKRLYSDINVSPDNRYLLVTWLEPPWSRTVPIGRFPKRIQLWRRDGSLVREMAYLPLAEDIPIAFDSCRQGPRGIRWRSDRPAEVYWIETQDGGDASVEASPRDIVYTLGADEAAADDAAAAAGNGNSHTPVQPRVLATTDLRCGGIAWGTDDLAILYESWWKNRRSVSWLISPGDPAKKPELLFDRSWEDAYTDPGSPLTRVTQWGTYVLALVDGKRKLLMEGTGASPEGNRPFLDLLDLDTRETRRLWQSSPPALCNPGSIFNYRDPTETLKLDGLQLTMSRESSKENPQTYVITLNEDPGAGPSGVRISERQVTQYPHPCPSIRDMTREVLRYKRADGVMLTATLYTPPGYNPEKDGRLPTIFWAYPREYKDKEAAGQMRRSPHQFASVGSTSPLLWLARGYAVLDGPSLPIVAEGKEEPNDTFLEQLCSSARAAINEGVRRGVVDPSRVSVGGHSYGSFMAANLLAHTDLFACGIARTGAFNRTLTPFGFQNEERTLWQAPDVYMRMSPFMAADKIKRPLLLIHGEDDNNPGTFPLQSERMYQALKGHGAVCRLVILPHESHSYLAYESIHHVLYEQDQWIERYAGFGRAENQQTL